MSSGMHDPSRFGDEVSAYPVKDVPTEPCESRCPRVDGALDQRQGCSAGTRDRRCPAPCRRSALGLARVCARIAEQARRRSANPSGVSRTATSRLQPLRRQAVCRRSQYATGPMAERPIGKARSGACAGTGRPEGTLSGCSERSAPAHRTQQPQSNARRVVAPQCDAIVEGDGAHGLGRTAKSLEEAEAAPVSTGDSEVSGRLGTLARKKWRQTWRIARTAAPPGAAPGEPRELDHPRVAERPAPRLTSHTFSGSCGPRLESSSRGRSPREHRAAPRWKRRDASNGFDCGTNP